jgi:hypothetical protein
MNNAKYKIIKCNVQNAKPGMQNEQCKMQKSKWIKIYLKL